LKGGIEKFGIKGIKMKGKIDEQGFLYIYRKNDYKIQCCPFDVKIGSICGDWCPLFSEPEKIRNGLKEYWKIDICNGKSLIFEEFKDERKNEEK